MTHNEEAADSLLAAGRRQAGDSHCLAEDSHCLAAADAPRIAGNNCHTCARSHKLEVDSLTQAAEGNYSAPNNAAVVGSYPVRNNRSGGRLEVDKSCCSEAGTPSHNEVAEAVAPAHSSVAVAPDHSLGAGSLRAARDGMGRKGRPRSCGWNVPCPAPGFRNTAVSSTGRKGRTAKRFAGHLRSLAARAEGQPLPQARHQNTTMNRRLRRDLGLLGVLERRRRPTPGRRGRHVSSTFATPAQLADCNEGLPRR
mmetsp:Transcript_84172/g.234692  ORF Transcript_84172/g.234692 Transcript_84172/m.234692 type:complete len:253 (+) Transcript_84172:1459-2217(+)